MNQKRFQILVIDPGVRQPEIDTYNQLVRLVAGLNPSPFILTYHMPALFGFDSLHENLTDGDFEIKAAIILGSAASVNEQLEWQRPLERFITSLIDRNIPTLGCCYGHQMLAAMFGGQVGYVRDDQSKLKGIRRINILKNPVWAEGSRSMIVTHAEEVKNLPPSLVRLASSDEVPIDGLMHPNRPIFGFQSHPESTKIFLKSREMLTPQNASSLQDGHQILYEFVDMAMRAVR